MHRKRSVVMGGAGFLGSHLCERLLGMGHDVVALDNFQSGSRANVERLLEHRWFSLVEHDVTTPFHMPCDAVYNLACPSTAAQYRAAPTKTTLTSVLGTLHALELAQAYDARLFLASSCDAHGANEADGVALRACHEEGTRCAESLAMDFHRTNRVIVRIGRIFDTYGPNMTTGTAPDISTIIAKALRDDEITLGGGGAGQRSLCYVDDLVDGILLAANSTTLSGPVDLGGAEYATEREVAEVVVELTDSQSRIRSAHATSEEAPPAHPDLTTAKTTLGFYPRIGLREGLERTIEHVRKLQASGVALPGDERKRAARTDPARRGAPLRAV
ncbi:MAG: NAD-dependent epimerase/dehydratase family protein [Polyangiaceae bacterium]|nr:NAD-dependent epimerase/dehydratase family protein [Polyangiaceae bacterium]